MSVRIRTPTAVMNTHIVKMLLELIFVPALRVSSVVAKSVEVKLNVRENVNGFIVFDLHA